MGDRFKVLLLFPPVWSPEAPYLSTPVLTSYLKHHGICATQRDFNILFWRHLASPRKIADTYGRLQEEWKRLGQAKELTEYQQRLQTAIAAVKSLELPRFLSEVQDGTIDRDFYQWLVHSVNSLARNGKSDCAAPDNDTQNGIRDYLDLLFWNISLSRHALSSQGLARIVQEEEVSPFVEFFEQTVLHETSTILPDVVGISIVGINQVVPAFTLARMVKKQCPKTHIVIGGSWCTHVRHSLGSILDQFEFIDSMVVFEGEVPLLQLCRSLEGGRDLASIPNVYFKRRGAVVASDVVGCQVDLDLLPTPDFEGLPLDEYDNPQSLPLQASRGCYWGNCTFCSYTVMEPQYKARKPSTVAADMLRLKNSHNTASFLLTDAAVSPIYARQLAQALLAKEVRVRWGAMARFDSEFTPHLLSLMARSGCEQVSWGLESGNSRVLHLIRKRIVLRDAERILQASAEVGIHNRVLVMYGHPTEEMAEAMDTVEFVRTNMVHIHSLSWNFYHPERETGIERLSRQHSLELVLDPRDDLSFGYRWRSQLADTEKAKICSEYRALTERIHRRLEGWDADPSDLVRLLRHMKSPAHSVPLPGRTPNTNVVSYVVRTGSPPRPRRRSVEVIEN